LPNRDSQRTFGLIAELDAGAYRVALLAKLLLGVAALYGLAWIGSFYLQRRLTYFPDPARTLPADAGLSGVEEITLATPDGERIIAWWGRARPGLPTLLYFHGNAGALADRAERISRFLTRGYGVFIMTYRSYGGSTGTPSERANVADAKLAYDTLVAGGVAAGDILIYGESLGTGIAMQVAVEKPSAGLILDAPYTSLLDVARLHYPHLPSGMFMTDRYETIKFLPQLKAPLLIVHGQLDRVIPAAMGQALFAAAPGPKQIALIPGAGHSDHYAFGSGEIISDWIARQRQPQSLRNDSQAAE
jgi:hypothetical protein